MTSNRIDETGAKKKPYCTFCWEFHAFRELYRSDFKVGGDEIFLSFHMEQVLQYVLEILS